MIHNPFLLSAGMFGAPTVYGGWLLATAETTSMGEKLIAGAIMIAGGLLIATFGVIIKHVTNTATHVDPKAELVSKETCEATAHGLGHSIDAIRADVSKLDDKIDRLITAIGQQTKPGEKEIIAMAVAIGKAMQQTQGSG